MKALLAGIVVCGLFSLPSLNIRGIPTESFNRTVVEVEVPELSAGYLNEAVLDPVADALIHIDGVKDLYCAAFDGGLLFQLSSNSEKDLLPDLGRTLRRLRRQLPYQAANPRIFTLPPPPSLVSFVFALDNVDPEITAQRLRELREELMSLKGVRSVSSLGIPDRELEIHLSTSKLVSAQLSPLQVKNALQESLFRMSAGVREGPYRRSDIVLSGGTDSLKDLLDLPVPLQSHGTGSYCHLKDVADIDWGSPLYRERIRYAGRDGGMIRVQFKRDSSLFERFKTIKIVDRIISSRTFILEHKNLYSTITGIIPPALFLLFSVLFSSMLLFRIRPFLQVWAAPALLLTLHALFARTIEPNTLIAMGFALLISTAFPFSGHRPYRLALVLVPVAAVQARLIGPGPLPLHTVLFQVLLALLLEGGIRFFSENKYKKQPSPCLLSSAGFTGDLRILLPGMAIILSTQILLFSPLEYCRMYAVLPHPGTGIPPGCEQGAFTMDFPQGPPEVLTYPLEHWLARFDPEFFIIGGDVSPRPDLWGREARVLPLSSGYGAQDLQRLFKAISSPPRP